MVSYLRKEQPIAILVSNYSSGLRYALVAKWLGLVKTKVIVAVYINISSYLQFVNTKGSRWRRFSRFLYYHGFYRLVNDYITPSREIADDLTRIIGQRSKGIRVIYNPVVTPELLQKAKRPVDHPYFADGAPPVILGVGRLSPQKDFVSLVKAFALIRERQPARLLILGEGEERSNLETLVHKLGLQAEVSLPGYVDNPYAYMSRAAVLVLSSTFEGSPLVLVEALACGTPVISTDCPSGPAELLEGGRYGRLVSVGDSEKLAEAMLETLVAPPNKELLMERAKEFSLEKAVSQYLEVFES
jgi:glycosyltransferase involved in cell wall biosynthesis